MTEKLKRTPLDGLHDAAGARMVDFGGWRMPVRYTGILDEHRATREAAGLFDVSHMGQVELRGPRALEAADLLFTNNPARLEDGRAQYSLLCYEGGGVVDDVLVYRLAAHRFLVCVNAVNAAKDYSWMKERAGCVCEVLDLSEEYAQIALQGPRAEEIAQKICEEDLAGLGYYRFLAGEMAGVEALIARTGYTGEDGFEIYLPPDKAIKLWEALREAGDSLGLKPVGLGARDTLRLEMKYPLYGHELTAKTTPLEAGLGWAVKLKGRSFIGAEALASQKREGVERRLVGLLITGRGIARQGHPVYADRSRVGEVTSGTHSPSLGKAIALAYVEAGRDAVGAELELEVRGRRIAAKVAETPFVVPGVKKG